MLTRFVTRSRCSEPRGSRLEPGSRPPSLRQVDERLAVAVGPLADHAVRGEVGDHRVAPPLLALVDVREVHLDDRDLEDVERVVDRVAVVRPRARVDDQPVGVAVGVVDPVDVLALVVRLLAAGASASSSRAHS